MTLTLPGYPTAAPKWGGLMQLLKPENPSLVVKTVAVWFQVDPATISLAGNDPDF
jgi:hypothetical protein